MTAWLEIGRPGNSLLAGAAVVVGAATAVDLGDAGSWITVTLAAASAALGTFGGNILNDLHDVEIDRRAHPARPLPSGRLGSRTAHGLLLAAWVASLAAAFAARPLLGAFALWLLLVLGVYEHLLKARGILGNAAVALAGGALFPFGAVAASGTVAPALVLGALAFLAHLGRELLKDAEDEAADRATRRTFAVRHGPRAASLAAAPMLVLAVALSPLPLVVADWDRWFLLAVLPADLLFLWSAWRGVPDPRRARRAAKGAMVLAMGAFLAASLL